MRREQHGASARRVRPDRAPERAASLDVHARRGLVEDEQTRVAEKRHREPEALLLAAGAHADAPVCERRDSGALHDLVDGAGVDEHAGGELEGLAYRDVLEEAAGLEDGGDEAVGDRRARCLAEHLDLALVGVGQPEEHVDRRGLTGAVGAEERDDLALADREVDAVDGADAAERLDEGVGGYGEEFRCRGGRVPRGVVHVSIVARARACRRGRVSRMRHDIRHGPLRLSPRQRPPSVVPRHGVPSGPRAAVRARWSLLRRSEGTRAPERPGKVPGGGSEMSDTITITGNVATEPEKRETTAGVAVTSFRLASKQRRFDRNTGTWVDGATNWYSVSVFRRLGEHAYLSLRRGDRIVVTGRLRLREWEAGGKRGWSAEIEADALGHDLLWGTTIFTRDASDREEADAERPLGQGSLAATEAAAVDLSDEWAAPLVAVGAFETPRRRPRSDRHRLDACRMPADRAFSRSSARWWSRGRWPGARPPRIRRRACRRR